MTRELISPCPYHFQMVRHVAATAKPTDNLYKRGEMWSWQTNPQRRLLPVAGWPMYCWRYLSILRNLQHRIWNLWFETLFWWERLKRHFIWKKIICLYISPYFDLWTCALTRFVQLAAQQLPPGFIGSSSKTCSHSWIQSSCDVRKQQLLKQLLW